MSNTAGCLKQAAGFLYLSHGIITVLIIMGIIGLLR